MIPTLKSVKRYAVSRFYQVDRFSRKPALENNDHVIPSAKCHYIVAVVALRLGWKLAIITRWFV